ncbi:site-2 protease family protein [Saccharomonospora sp. NPDC046836]|uniref:site-2 protease family protein n=1 Tax=Saccharomonospora sp. NPDC046836 TaxID=3156921 RepID=UPI0033FA0B3C
MFRSAIPLGRIAGIAVAVHWSVLIAVFLFTQILAVQVLPATVPRLAPGWYWVAATVTSLCLLASLLAHELAHALLARHYGVRVGRVTLWLLGGVAELESEPPTARADLVIAAGGPAASLGIGGVCWGIVALTQHWLPELLLAGLLWLALTNIVLGVFNLLPGAPLDGGRVVRALVWKRGGDRVRANAVAARCGQVLGVALAVLGLAEALLAGRLSGLWLSLIGWFLIVAAQAELSGGRLHQLLDGVPVRAVMTTEPVTAPGWWTVDAFLDHVAASARHRAFPVLSFEGRPLGVVSLADVAKLPADRRLATRVCDISRTPPAVTMAAPDDPLTDVVSKIVLRPGRDLLLVCEQGTLVGIVSAGDLSRALELAALAPSRPSAPTRPTRSGARDAG